MQFNHKATGMPQQMKEKIVKRGEARTEFAVT
jgi:hypothetical protein